MTAPKRSTSKEAPRQGLPEDVARALENLQNAIQAPAAAASAAPSSSAAKDLRDAAAKLLRAADALERDALKSRHHSGTNSSKMVAAARVRHSQSAPADSQVGRLVVIAGAAGHTIRSLGEAIGCSHVAIGRGVRGERAFRQSWAKEIARLTRSQAHPHGFEATAENYPGGWAREPE